MTTGEREAGAPEARGGAKRPSLAERTLDLESLKALAHPLRVQIIDILSTFGEFTASGLAERLGESSGATSYHLRQLERHGFVREVVGKGTARERWWERVPGGIELSTDDLVGSAAGRAATQTVLRQFERGRSGYLSDFVERGMDALGAEWFASAALSTMNLNLTRGQLVELVGEWETFAKDLLARYRGQSLPGSRPVQVHFNAFPVIDGEESS